MDVALWIVLIAAVFYGWVRLIEVVVKAEKRASTKARFDEITHGLFGDDDART